MRSIIKYLNESIDNTNEYVYHVVTSNNSLRSIKKYGLCSPRRLYEVNKKLFKLNSYKIYKPRTAIFFNKSERDVTLEDILEYLDKSPTRTPEFTSNSLFFSFLSIKQHHKEFHSLLKPYIELKLPVKYLKTLGDKPVLVGPGPPTKFTTWSVIEDPSFLDIVRKGALKKPHRKLKFKYVMHLALDAYHIPYSKFK